MLPKNFLSTKEGDEKKKKKNWRLIHVVRYSRGSGEGRGPVLKQEYDPFMTPSNRFQDSQGKLEKVWGYQ